MAFDQAFIDQLNANFAAGVIGFEDNVTGLNRQYPVKAALDHGTLMIYLKEAHHTEWMREWTLQEAISSLEGFWKWFKRQGVLYKESQELEVALIASTLAHSNDENFGSW